MELTRNNFFEEHFHLLAGIYESFAFVKDEGYLELSKSEFVKILKDSEVLIKPKPLKVEDKNSKDKGDKKDGEDSKSAVSARKFEEMDANDAIENINCFEGDQMDYVDFLEAIVRIAIVYPFSDEEMTEILTFENRVEFFLKKFEITFKEHKKLFENKMLNPYFE